MKMVKRKSNFWLCLFVNLCFNLEWSIPAWILLALHYWRKWPVWLFWLALGIWIAGIVLWMRIIGWVAKCGSTPEKPKENKNPYSVKRIDKEV